MVNVQNSRGEVKSNGVGPVDVSVLSSLVEEEDASRRGPVCVQPRIHLSPHRYLEILALYLAGANVTRAHHPSLSHLFPPQQPPSRWQWSMVRRNGTYGQGSSETTRYLSLKSTALRLIWHLNILLLLSATIRFFSAPLGTKSSQTSDRRNVPIRSVSLSLAMQ